jgi:hypothetical protein
MLLNGQTDERHGRFSDHAAHKFHDNFTAFTSSFT